MVTRYEIPLISQSQKFNIVLAGVSYKLNVHWCIPANAWVLDMLDKNDLAILTGIPLVTGVNLFDQYDYLNLGGQLIAATDNDPDLVPTYENLGSLGHLYFDVP